MCWPELQAVKDVRCVDDGSPPLLTLLCQEAHQVSTTKNIQVHSDLIKKQHLRGDEHRISGEGGKDCGGRVRVWGWVGGLG